MKKLKPNFVKCWDQSKQNNTWTKIITESFVDIFQESQKKSFDTLWVMFLCFLKNLLKTTDDKFRKTSKRKTESKISKTKPKN